MTIFKKCNECGVVHEGITSQEIIVEIYDFGVMFSELTPAERVKHYNNKMPDITSYIKCADCDNNYDNFTDAEDYVCPNNVIPPMILVD